MDWLCLFTSHLHPFLLTYLSHLCLVCVRCGSAAIVLIGLYAAPDACWLAEFLLFLVCYSLLVMWCAHIWLRVISVFIWLLILSNKCICTPSFSPLYFFIFLFRYVNPTSLVSYGNVTSFCSGLLFRLDWGGGNSGMGKAECLIIINTLRFAFRILLICMCSCQPLTQFHWLYLTQKQVYCVYIHTHTHTHIMGNTVPDNKNIHPYSEIWRALPPIRTHTHR